MPDVHATAIVEPGARLADDVKIGPYSLIGPDVVLEAGVVVHGHVVVNGRTTVGAGSTIYPFASIGMPPQDLKYKGEPSTLEIGRHNILREHVTINPGTAGGGMVTRIGDRCLLMIGCHVAHDCMVGDHVVMANSATLGGHVVVGDYAILGGLAAVHQFVRIGHHAMVGGMSGVESDVIPYGSALGNRAQLSGLNIIGLKRRGFTREQVHALRTAYRLLFAEEGTIAERLQDVAQMFADSAPVMDIVSFIRADSARAICQPRTSRAA